MKTLFYSSKDFEIPYLKEAWGPADAVFETAPLSAAIADKAKDFEAISIFTNDDAAAPVLETLYRNGTRLIAIRAAGYDNVDIEKAAALGITIANVPEYSPYAIAEHAVALVLALSRKLITANRQVHQHNYTTGNLIGFDLHGKTVGIIGTGRIGSIFAKIMHGFGCNLVGFDIKENDSLKEKYGLKYIDLPDLCREAEIISIHTPLTPHTKYIINKKTIGLVQRGMMLINTSRGACVHTADVMEAVDNGHIGYFGTDVYENEKGIFFYDHSGKEPVDELLKKMLAHPNVLVTPHQAFATREALFNIAETTFDNIDCWYKRIRSGNELTATSDTANSFTNNT
jgi:D-lactate dehydrogenase